MRLFFFGLTVLIILFQPVSAQDFVQEATQVYDLGQTPEDVSLGDFDGDGLLDVVISNTYYVFGEIITEGSISVLFNNGDRTFDPAFTPNELQLGARCEGVAAADFNGDGYDDIAAATFDSGDLHVLLSNGPSRGFGSPSTLIPQGRPRHVRAALLNGDAHYDLMTANHDDDNLSVFLGNGDGTFALQPVIAAGNGPESIVFAHVNTDNGNFYEDVIVPNSLGDTVSVFHGQGDGTFVLGATVSTGDDEPRHAVAYDFNGDGVDDFVTSHFRGADSVKVYRNTGSGTGFVEEFSDGKSTSDLPTGHGVDGPIFHALGDLNHDGLMDFIVGFLGPGDNVIGYYQGSGGFNFSRQLIPTGNRPYGSAIHDFDNDGARDLFSVEIADNAITFRFGTPQTASSLDAYFTMTGSGSVDGISYTEDDILRWDGTDFEMHFDGSDVGVAGGRVNAIHVIDSSQILMTFNSAQSALSGFVGTVDDSDIVLFQGTSFGTTTSGTFSLFFDGSDVGLSTSSEEIDALTLMDNGDLLISTLGSFGVTGVSGTDRDLLRFTPTSTGSSTSGTWQMYFDGSDVQLNLSDEDLDALALDDDDLLFSVNTALSVTGLSANDEDVARFTPTSTGSTTQGSYSSTLFVDGSAIGLNGDICGLSVFITDGPTAPIAVNDGYSLDEDTTLSEPPASGVLDNDSDPEGDPLTALPAGLPTNGNLTLDPDGSFVYTPDPNFSGVDSFQYVASDGATSSPPATVTLTVNNLNDPPVATSQAISIAGATPTPITLAASDVDLDALTFSINPNPGNGSLTGTPPDVTYTPDGGYTGPDSFSFTANDGTVDSNTATIFITVTAGNTPPVANAQSVMTDEDVGLGITLTGSDADGDPLTFSIVDSPSNGGVTGSPPNVTYTPALNFNGADSFTFRANDGTVNGNTATISITVDPQNDPPLADDQGVSTVEDTPLPVTLTGSDVDGDPLTFAVQSGPSSGMLTGTPPDLTYTPNAAYTGLDSFTFTANDGMEDSNLGTVSITVNPNQAPTADNQNASTAENTPALITLTGSDPEGDPLSFVVDVGPSNGMLTGTPPDLTYTPDTDYSGPDSFTFYVNDGSQDSPSATVSITVTPTGGGTGELYISFNSSASLPGVTAQDEDIVAYDGSTYSILFDGSDVGLSSYVLDGFDLISPTEILFSLNDNATLSGISGTIDDSDIILFTATTLGDSTSGSFSLYFDGSDVGLSSGGEDIDAITRLPNGNLVVSLLGSYSVTGASGGDEDLLEFTPTTLGPSTTGTWSTYFDGSDVGMGDSGEDVDALLIDSSGDILLSTTGTPSITGVSPTDEDVFRFTPTALGTSTSGSFSSMLVFDGSASGVASGEDVSGFDMADGPIPNQAPVAQDQGVTVEEDTPTPITLVATDANGDPLTYSVQTGPSSGMLAGTPPDLTYTPNAAYTGPDSFTFTANDGMEDSNLGTVSITVNPNQAPTADNQNASTAEDTPALITLTGSDPEGDPLSFFVDTGPSNGMLTGTPPNLTYTPNAEFTGPDSFTFYVNDGSQDSPNATVSITVTPTGGGAGELYVSFNSSASLPGVTAQDEDIVAYNGSTYSMLFDGSDVGLSSYVLDAFDLISPTEILFSLDDNATLSGISGTIDDSDIVLFTATTLGDSTSGSFSLYFDGSDVGLSSGGEDVDAITRLPNGNLVVSVFGSYSVTGASGGDEDLLEFTPTTLGTNTTGTWSLYFDGSDVGMGDSGEDVDALLIDSSGDILLSTTGTPGITGVSPTDEDVFRFTPTALGTSTSGSFSSMLVFDGSASGVASGEDVSGFDMADGPIPNQAPVAQDQGVTVEEDTATPITLVATDANGDSLTYSVQTGPSSGMLAGTPPNLTYTPNAAYTGPDSFTFTANDGMEDSNLGTVSITVTANQAPTADNQNVSTAEDTPALITLTGSDPEGDPLSFFVDTGPSNGMLTGTPPNLTYTPDAEFTGPDSFTFYVNDGSQDSPNATVSITVTPGGGGNNLYFSFPSATNLGSFTAQNEDIVAYNGSTYSMLFDGSDVGLGSYVLDAFDIISPTEILFSLNDNATLSGVSGTVDDSDIVLFTATSLGDSTSGSFTLYFDGSDVEFSAGSEDIDAITMLPNGNLVVSVLGSYSVTGASGGDEDLLEFTPTTLGTTTAGTWSVYFDGSDVGMGDSGEDVNGLHIDSSGDILLSTTGTIGVTGVSAQDEDVFRFIPTALGTSTSGTFSPTLVFNGSASGVSGDVTGFDAD